MLLRENLTPMATEEFNPNHKTVLCRFRFKVAVLSAAHLCVIFIARKHLWLYNNSNRDSISAKHSKIFATGTLTIVPHNCGDFLSATSPRVLIKRGRVPS